MIVKKGRKTSRDNGHIRRKCSCNHAADQLCYTKEIDNFPTAVYAIFVLLEKKAILFVYYCEKC
jgi:hypothetical protein